MMYCDVGKVHNCFSYVLIKSNHETARTVIISYLSANRLINCTTVLEYRPGKTITKM